jgi:transposase
LYPEEETTIEFPIVDLLDEQECHDYLFRTLHPNGLVCPRCGHPLPPDQAPHDRSRDPIFDYLCRQCGRVFNLFTGTVWQGTHYDCRTIVLVVRGFAQGIPTLHLANELNLDRGTLLERRHRIQQLAWENRPTEPLPDDAVEGDEMFQNAGEKSTPHHDPDDPPRRRGNNRPGAGTMENDRPPVQGVVGRTSGQIRLWVCDDTKQTTIQPNVESATRSTVSFYSDESTAYRNIASTGRDHATVCHSQREWARDDDGDGIREVHCNTMEGTWTGLRNFLRPFRGVHEKYLALYVAMFEWEHNLKRVTPEFMRMLMVPV